MLDLVLLHDTVRKIKNMKIFIVHSGGCIDPVLKDDIWTKVSAEFVYTIDVSVLDQALVNFPKIDLVVLLEDVSVKSMDVVEKAYVSAPYKPYTLSLGTKGPKIKIEGCVHEHVKDLEKWNRTLFIQSKKQEVPL